MLTLKLAIVPLMMSQILAMDTQGRVKLNLWILHNLLGKLFRIYYSIQIKLIFGFPHILKMKFWKEILNLL